MLDTELKYNPTTNKFVVYSNDEELATKVGLTLAKKNRGPQGQKVWFTDESYAALPFWDVADDAAKERLAPLKRDFIASKADSSDSKYPAPFGKEYLPYQLAGIDYALDRKNCLIGDEPGLGKTIQAIGLANATGAKKILVICPASIRLNWQREIRDWSTLRRVSTYPILKSKDGVNPHANYVIISYELARSEAIWGVLCNMKWDLLVIDEAHYLKSPEAKRTQAVFGGGNGMYKGKGIADRCDRVLALTGTPLPNRPRECYMLARALCFESIDWISYDNFCYRFNPSKLMEIVTAEGEEKSITVEKRGRLPELQARLRCNFMIRRLKADVLKDLPDKRYEMSYVEPNGRINQVLAKEKLIDFNLEDLRDPNSELFGQISTIRREMGEAKIPRIIEHMHYLMDILELPKVVLFSHHKAVMDGIMEGLARYNPVQVRGGMTPNAKHQSVLDFMEQDDVRIFSGQLDAAGFGIDGLQKVASRVVFAEPAWTPGTNEQAVDRCHRIGQHDNVLAEFLVVESSLDERVLASVLEKAKDIHDVLDNGV